METEDRDFIKHGGFTMVYEKAKNISFPLGGIGTGCIGLSGNGELIDWEILNRPNKNTRNGYSHFAVKAVCKDKTVVKVLHGDTNENYIGTRHPDIPGGFDFGPRYNSMAGFPHFRDVQFDGAFPMAKLHYSDEDFPAVLHLCAFNPFIPHDAFHSSLPVALFEWEIENIAEESVEYSLSFCVQNPSASSKNQALEHGCFLGCAGKKKDEIGYCDLSMLTDADGIDVQACWYRGAWRDGVTTYWRELSQMKHMPARSYSEPPARKPDHATVVASVRLMPKERKKIRFVLAWNAPTQYNYWSPFRDENGKDVTWKNYYATQFDDSLATATYVLSKFDDLMSKTQRFTDLLQKSSLPDFVIDAVSANLSVLKSPTVLRLEDGSFWAWEGVHDREGLCEGSCQHVWNYAYALPFLFPELERSMRENTIKYGIDPHGKSDFRLPLPIGRRNESYIACVDGQMGEVIKCYREWKVCGDTDWLKKHSEAIFSMLEFAWSEHNSHAWDADRDGVIDGRQHNTLDIELFGANSWLQGFYLLALDCAAEMAEALGEKQRAETYRELYEKGRAWTNEHLFNGEYFGQIVDLSDKSIVDKFSCTESYWNDEAKEIKYQLGEGCVIDQMLADWHAAMIGKGEVFDGDKKHTALESLYRYNYIPSMRNLANTFRNFALNDEAGTIICSYPKHKNTPAIPILYGTETVTGFEYALGGLMLSQGMIAEGEEIIKTVRDRYDGEKRNPWSEIECGHNYARSMASYALLLIYSGFSFDMTKKQIGFDPIRQGDGRYFWSVGNSYGNMEYKGDKQTLSVVGDELALASFGLRDGERAVCVSVDGSNVPFEQNGKVLSFATVNVRSALTIQTEKA